MRPFPRLRLLVLIACAHALARRIAAVAILTRIHLNGVQGAIVLTIAVIGAAVYAAADAHVSLFLAHNKHILSRVVPAKEVCAVSAMLFAGNDFKL